MRKLLAIISLGMALIASTEAKEKLITTNPLKIPDRVMVKTIRYITPLPATPVIPVQTISLSKLDTKEDHNVVLVVLFMLCSVFLTLTIYFRIQHRRKRNERKKPDNDEWPWPDRRAHIRSSGDQFFDDPDASDERPGKPDDPNISRSRAIQPYVPEGKLAWLFGGVDRAGHRHRYEPVGPRVPYDSAVGAWSRALRAGKEDFQF